MNCGNSGWLHSPRRFGKTSLELDILEKRGDVWHFADPSLRIWLERRVL